LSFRQGITGHEKQIDTIERALESGTLPHAYLFSGMGGIGKRLIALKLAETLQCNSPESRPCGKCSGCRKIKEGNHPDLIELQADGNFIKIEQIRGLQKRLSLKSFEGRATVCIIDGAEKMNPAAANALLKTLEEPPQDTYLILLTENIRQVISTVISRCRRLNFNPLSADNISSTLIKDKGIDKKDAIAAAGMSEGSMGKALDLLECFDAKEREQMFELVIDFKNVDDVFSISEKLTKKEGTIKLMDFIDMLKFFLRDLMVFKSGVKKDRLLNIASDEILKKGAGSFSPAALIEIFETVAKTETAIMMNVNKRLAVENMLLKFYNKKADIC